MESLIALHFFYLCRGKVRLKMLGPGKRTLDMKFEDNFP
jgi:hypothetical protein